jgi:ferredoxin
MDRSRHDLLVHRVGENVTIGITWDADKCGFSGLCSAIAPQIFALNEDGTMSVDQEAVVDNVSAAEEAADACPMSAIAVTR